MATGPLLSLVNRLKELFGGEPLPKLPPLHGHGGCQQRCQQVEEESDPGDVNSEPKDESEPDEPEFAKNLQLAPSSSSGCSFSVESPRNLFGSYQAFRCYLQENQL